MIEPMMDMELLPLHDLVRLRQDLHRQPELSNTEKNTAHRICRFLEHYPPDEVIRNLGGHGLAAVYDSQKTGPTRLLRADLDALPIHESNPLEYCSTHQGVSHKCGHDGHMTILAGVAALLSGTPPENGRVVLLFQPAEETGEGAERVLRDPRFSTINPDMVFALHNLPGYSRGTVLLKAGVFAAASIGLVVTLTGKTSHAGEPRHGLSPALALSQLISSYSSAPQNKTGLWETAKVTVIHARLGDAAFGTSPGSATLMVTLRSSEDTVIHRLKTYCIELANAIGKAHGLTVTTHTTDAFPVTRNDPAMVEAVDAAAHLAGLNVEYLDHPFPWSEDFGHFTAKYPGALFGLGAGTDQPALHHPDYDFPDDVIVPGVSVFTHLVHSMT